MRKRLLRLICFAIAIVIAGTIAYKSIPFCITTGKVVIMDRSSDYISYLRTRCNWLPLNTTISYIRMLYHGTINTNIVFHYYLANILPFALLGFLFCCCFQNILISAGLTCAVAALVEILQFALKCGRFDIEAIAIRTASAIIGAVIFELIIKQTRCKIEKRDL